jgi:divalent metal cation (Fe/Co/Zn/Cd) transporter
MTDSMPADQLQKKALFLSYFTVGYNLLEGGLALAAGGLAGSIALVGFGLDSLVESLSGAVMIWRFWHQGRLGPLEEARRERRAVRLVAYTFFLLGAYVLFESVSKLYSREIPAPSLFGIIIAAVAAVAMPTLFFLKYRTAGSLASASLAADARQTLGCFFLSLALLVGLGLNYLWGWWQADPLVGLLVVVFLFKEGYAAFKTGKVCACCSC